MNCYKLLRSHIAATMLGLSSGQLVHAQENPAAPQPQADELGEIIVTARLRRESLADVPGTVSVLTADALSSAGVKRAADFIAMTPGVSMVNAIEVGDTQVNIRGMNSARDAEQSFAFVLDGILMSNTAAFNREFVDLEQVEISKGPQGAIYGRNAAAGAILVTTRLPSNETEAQVKTSYSSAGDQRYVVGSVGGAIVRDKLAFRLSADYRSNDGLYKNTYDPERKVDDYRGRNLSARLLWTPSDDVKVDLKSRIGRIRGSSITFNAAFSLPAFESAGGFEDVNEHNFLFVNNVPEQKSQAAFELSAKTDIDLHWATLTAWGLYSNIDNRFLADGTSGGFGFFANEPNCAASAANIGVGNSQLFPPPTFNSGNPLPFLVDPAHGSFYTAYTPTTCDGYQYQRRWQKDKSAEVRLTSPNSGPLRWQGGLYFLGIDREVGVASGLDPSYPTALGGTGQSIIPALITPFTQSLDFDRFTSHVYAVFGNAQYDLTRKIELSAAVRYDSEARKVDNLVPTPAQQASQYITPPYLNPAFIPGITQLNANGTIPSRERTFSQVEPKLSMTWHATDHTNLFANWGIGFKSGGFNNQGAAATVELFINRLNGTSPDSSAALRTIGGAYAPVLISDDYKKETSSAFETGFKSRPFGGNVSIEGAAYYTDVKNMQFFEFMAGPFGLLRVVNGIDKVSIWGGELAITARPVTWLKLFASGNVTGSRIQKMISRPDAVGNKSPYTPDYTVNSGFEVTHGLGNSDWLLSARLDFEAVGPTWFHVIQNQRRPTIFSAFDATHLVPGGILFDGSRTRRDPYNTTNLRIGLEGKRYSVTGFIQNLTDRRYLQEVDPAPEFGGSFIVPSNNERSFGVELSARY